MNTLKTLFTASAIALSLGGAALASDSTEIGNPGMLLFQNGTMTSIAVGSKTHKMIMEHAKPITGVKLEWIGEICVTLPRGQIERLRARGAARARKGSKGHGAPRDGKGSAK